MRQYLRLIGTPVTLLLLLAFLLYGGWWGFGHLLAPVVATPTPCTTQGVGKTLASSKVSVRVYNGGTEVGLASRVATQLRGVGFITLGTGNTGESVGKTVIVGSTKDAPAVRLVAAFFKGATIRADHRIDGTVDVLVGDDYAGMNTAAPRSIAVPGGKVCLPPPSAPATAPTAKATP